jgi:L-lactate dehydrogenase complex protein LldE
MMRPEIGLSTVTLLEQAGCTVTVPMAQTCCGQPAWNSGDAKATQALLRKFLDEFEGFEAIVAPSGSCTGMVVKHYRDVARDDPALLGRVEAIAAKTHELTNFLVNVLKMPAGFFSALQTGTKAQSITYHDCCSGLRELGIARQPRQLIADNTPHTLKEMSDSRACCGFGGTFSLKYGDISAAICDDKCASIHSSGAACVVMGDLGCMLNIEGRLRHTGDQQTRVIHIAQVLAGDI